MASIPQTHIRNFSIIAHIDHGKSTLADRMLEHTSTIDARNMQAQVLDNMDLERERGITIKMQPVRMEVEKEGQAYALNLIDTPGHIDFSYEVSRALKAVEGTLLLVDATQGVQAQTLTTLEAAKAAGLTIIPVLSKVDSPRARIEDVSIELVELLDCEFEDIILTSGKTGEGVEELITRIISDIAAPKNLEQKEHQSARALVFDFEYSEHQGVIVYARVMDGSFKPGSNVVFIGANKNFKVSEVGHVVPHKQKVSELQTGEIGYIVTGIKQAGIVSVGDTLTIKNKQLPALAGYSQPSPVVWASLYPEAQDDFDTLRLSLDRLRLHDSSLVFEEESSGVLGRGFRCGFLGMLHLEIITERLRREFNIQIVITTPTVEYVVTQKGCEPETIYTPAYFPGHGDIENVLEPWVQLSILSPKEYLSGLMQLYFEHEGDVVDTRTYTDGRVAFEVEMPLRELMRNFFDEIKSITAGYASVAYKPIGMREAHVARLDILVAGDSVPAFTRIVSEQKAQSEAEDAVERLHKILPRQMFVVKIQAQVKGRIISSRSIRALKKDVTGHLYGGDITRKMKLRDKQKKGKKRMAARGRVNIPQDVFLKMVKREG